MNLIGFIVFLRIFLSVYWRIKRVAFIALTLLVGPLEGHMACKN